VKEGDVVAAGEGLGGDVAAEEHRAAEDEQAHDAQPNSCAQRSLDATSEA
jgi:hypothetical protein